MKNILIIRDGEHILSEANGRRSRQQVMISWPVAPAGEEDVDVLQPGTLLAWTDDTKTVMTAYDGSYPDVPAVPPATDDTPDPRTEVAGILFARLSIDDVFGTVQTNPANNSYRGVAHVVDTEVNGYKIVRAFDDTPISNDPASSDHELILALRDLGIRVQF